MAMKIRTTKYIFKEGIFNTYKNKLMSLASISIVAASLVIFGVFLLIAFNLNNNVRILQQQPEIQIFCRPELDDSQVAQVEQQVGTDNEILEFKKVTKQEAYEKLKEILGNDAITLQGLDNSFLPVSFIVKLKDSTGSAEFVDRYMKVEGVENVRYSQKTIDFISKLRYWVHIVSIILVAILLLVSVFIIANTIKMTVFARRREISIMKYVGATDWFIRWPFIIEGVIIGFIGAVIAFIIVSYGYNTVVVRFNRELSYITTNFIKLMSLKEIWIEIIVFYTLTGVVVGALGSVISIRKYLRV